MSLYLNLNSNDTLSFQKLFSFSSHIFFRKKGFDWKERVKSGG
jgi:hypothetical protein